MLITLQDISKHLVHDSPGDISSDPEIVEHLHNACQSIKSLLADFPYLYRDFQSYLPIALRDTTCSIGRQLIEISKIGEGDKISPVKGVVKAKKNQICNKISVLKDLLRLRDHGELSLTEMDRNKKTQVEEKFTRNFRVNGEMREKKQEYDLLLDEF